MSNLYDDLNRIFSIDCGRDICESIYHGYIDSFPKIVENSITNYSKLYLLNDVEKEHLSIANDIKYDIVSEVFDGECPRGTYHQKVVRFQRDDEFVYIQFTGVHKSHYGDTYDFYYRVDCIEKTIIVYE